MSNKQSPFLRYIHNFRGVAIVLIVLGHINGYLTYEDETWFYKFCVLVFTNGSVYFVFIAGFLFQHLLKGYKYIDYLFKKIRYVIIPYLIISTYGVFHCIFILNKPATLVWFSDIFSTWSVPHKAIVLYLTGAQLYPFWFIPMISIFYLISPALVWIDKVPKRYLVLLLLMLLSLLIPRPPDHNIFLLALHFLSAYVLGMFASRYKEKCLDWLQKNFLYLVVASLLMLLGEFYWRSSLGDFNHHLSINTLSKEIQCFILLYVLWRTDLLLPKAIHSTFNFLATLSFGIYFIHGYIANFVGNRIDYIPFIGAWLKQGSPITFTIFALFTTLASSGIILLIKKMTKNKSRYVCGC